MQTLHLAYQPLSVGGSAGGSGRANSNRSPTTGTAGSPSTPWALQDESSDDSGDTCTVSHVCGEGLQYDQWVLTDDPPSTEHRAGKQPLLSRQSPQHASRILEQMASTSALRLPGGHLALQRRPVVGRRSVVMCRAAALQQATPGKTTLGFVGLGIMGVAMVRHAPTWLRTPPTLTPLSLASSLYTTHSNTLLVAATDHLLPLMPRPTT